MPKEEKEVAADSRKAFHSYQRSEVAGSISPMQRGLLRKMLLRSPRGDFVQENMQKAKKQCEGLFSST